MGNCCGSESHEPEKHEVKTLNHNKPKKAPTTGGGQALGGSTDINGAASREAMLQAAEKRKQEAENRGVKEGSKLSKQLAEEKRQNKPTSPKNELDDRLVWD